MRLRERRWVGVVVVATLALGLVATTGIDVAVAQQRRAHDRKVAAARAERRAERAYLQAVRRIAADVFAATEPYNEVLDSLSSDPFRGDIYEARDAFASPAASTRLAGLVSALDALRPPAPMRPSATKLHAALASLERDVMAIRRQAGVENGPKLFAAIDTAFSTDLSSHEVDWSLAMTSAFDRQHSVPPAVPGGGQTSPATMVTWVFHADRACDRTFDAVSTPLGHLAKHVQTATDFAVVGRALAVSSKALRRLTLPASDAIALRREVLARLTVVDATSRTLALFARAVARVDAPGVRAALGKLVASGHAVIPLINAFHARHVTSCVAMLQDLVEFPDSPPKRAASVAT